MAAVGTLLTEKTRDLQEAIRSGNVEQSQQLARLLAEEKAQLIVSIDQNSSAATTTPGNLIKLKVNFEGQHFSSGNSVITFDVNPMITFHTLKKLVCKRFGFPPDIQRCIVGRLCPEDDKVVSQCGLWQNSDELFIYLLSNELIQRDATPGYVISSSDTPSDRLQTFTSLNCESASSALNTAMFSPVQTVGHSSASITSAGDTAAGTTSVEQKAATSLLAADTRQIECHTPDLQPWSCIQCTYENHYSMPVCEMCEFPRPNTVQNHDVIDITDGVDDDDDDMDYVTLRNDLQPSVSQKEPVDRVNYNDLLAMEYCNLIENTDVFQCPICFDDINRGCGVVLRDCLHCFCRTCLADHIRHCENAIVTCPFNNGDYKCQSELQDREIRALVTDEVYERHLLLSAREAESCAAQSYHCATPDCAGWCTYEDDVNTFFCYACRHVNCLTCRAIHEGQDCREYQRELQLRAHTDRAAMLANSTLEELLKTGDAMKCPRCDVIIIKKEGCDWVMCTVCKLEICWVTQQARWGPAGRGDTSGGCKCRVNGKLCHPRCQNCH